ncbi:MAG: pentapeptide repeat-containing protein, partial [Bacillus sp. (in: firmicutes)]
MRKTLKIQQPKIPTGITPFDYNDREDSYVNMAIISDCSISQEEVERLRFEEVVFKNVTFIDGAFRFVELTDVIFERCDLSNVDFTDGIIHRVEFRDSKLLGLNLADATLRNVLFENCNLNMGSFG